MANKQPTTAESSVSKTKDEVIQESKRIEEALLFSSKGHFAAASFWTNFHLVIGIPIVILSAIAGASILKSHEIMAGVLSLFVTVLSGLLTYLNPNEKAAAHLNAGNNYDSLMSKVRIFWAIDCWGNESEQVLTKRLKDFSERKSKFNQECPQVPTWAYLAAKKGITAGEGDYSVDKK